MAKDYRVYDFQLPYEIGSFYLSMGMYQLKEEGILDRLPEDLQDRVNEAVETGSGIVVEKEDLDKIDEDTWTRLAQKLNLSWRKVPSHKTVGGTTSGGMEW